MIISICSSGLKFLLKIFQQSTFIFYFIAVFTFLSIAQSAKGYEINNIVHKQNINSDWVVQVLKRNQASPTANDLNDTRQNFAIPKPNPTIYKYDDLGRLTDVVYPDGSMIAYQYDEIGNRGARNVLLNHVLDVDHNGVINKKDAMMILKALTGESLTGLFRDADINEDGKLGLEEVIYIQKISSQQ